MNKPFLIEITTEELPALPLLKEIGNAKDKWSKILQKNGFETRFELFYTPRRVVLWHEEFAKFAKEETLEFFGPPLTVAFKDGVPTKAFDSFIAKSGLSALEIGQVEKDGKTVLFGKKTKAGGGVADLANTMISEWLKSLTFGKAMRWGSLNEEFIRPIRNIVAIYDSEVLDVETYGVKSSSYIFGHRQDDEQKARIFYASEYFDVIAKHGVILKQNERRTRILQGIAALEKEHGISVEIDEELLNEIVAISEYPTPLFGKFDEAFLEVAPEAIITSMKTNQRYFPVFKDGKLFNGFIVVSNAFCIDFSKIVAGNERVLRARLSDALFFWNNDLKNGLNPSRLESVVFIQNAGTMADKSERERTIAELLAQSLDAKEANNIVLAAKLAKADLMSEMVYEFPELQGIMGYYYAKAAGLDDTVAIAIKEQYLPNGEESEMPSTNASAIVALATKLDSLAALFSVGMIPTGAKDPYALRRAANGVIKIALNRRFPFNLRAVLNSISHLYKPFDVKQLEDFILERMSQLFDKVNPSIVRAIIASSERNICAIAQKIEALDSISQGGEFRQNFQTFKRVANISKDVDLDNIGAIDTKYFENSFEHNLLDSFKVAISVQGSHYDSLKALFNLQKPLEEFFENCMVNADDLQIRNNRKNLIAQIYKSFLQIADIKEITL
ncbi:MAG: hypothetical protein RL154_283 [Pseudomonadota bacterium]|jgi:glycyl-tRNA synthetase beta chain